MIVACQYFVRPLHQVSYSLPDGMAVYQQKLQIFTAIVLAIAVFVMNVLKPCQWSAELFVHNKSMFEHVTLRVRHWMIWQENPHVAAASQISSSVPGVVFTATIVNAGTMTVDKTQRIAEILKMLRPTSLGNWRFLSTAASAKTSQELFNIYGWFKRFAMTTAQANADCVSRQKSWRPISMMSLGCDRISAPAFTVGWNGFSENHMLIISQIERTG